MTLKEHKKHTSLARPSFGNFGRNEWAFVGAPCGIIKEMAGIVIAALSPIYRCAYVDASHQDEVAGLPGRLAAGAILELTDQTDHIQLDHNTPFSRFKLREAFSGVDLVLVNGNHHQAKAQVVIISEKKKGSLQKRLAQLTDVQLFLLADDGSDIFEFVKTAITGWEEIPVLRLEDTHKIVAFFTQKMQQVKPVLNGLVLAGGKSERMGSDKGTLNWHGAKQRYHMADMLQGVCGDVFISIRPDQQGAVNPSYKVLVDTFMGLGPYGAILSAFREQPDSAWLVIACDLPLMDEATLQHLVNERDMASIATAYQSPVNEFPEPLIAIWEPKSYPVLLSFLAQGYSCPRKVLINRDIKLLQPPFPGALTNVNTPEEFEKVKRVIQQTEQQHEA